ncbi:MAG: PAS domain S-box protein, partial [Lentisphaerae bacterium]
MNSFKHRLLLIITTLWWGGVLLFFIITWENLEHYETLISPLVRDSIQLYLQKVESRFTGTPVLVKEKGRYYLSDHSDKTPKRILDLKEVLPSYIETEFIDSMQSRTSTRDILLPYRTHDGKKVFLRWNIRRMEYFSTFKRPLFLAILFYLLFILAVILWLRIPFDALHTMVCALQRGDLPSRQKLGLQHCEKEVEIISEKLIDYFRNTSEQINRMHDKVRHLENLLREHITFYCRCNPDGRILECNQEFSEFLGETQENVLERPFHLFVYPEDREKVEEFFASDHVPDENEELIRFFSAKGDLHYFLWRWQVVYDSGSDRPAAIVGVGIDQTARFEAEISIRQLSEAQSKLWKLGEGLVRDPFREEAICQLLEHLGTT